MPRSLNECTIQGRTDLQDPLHDDAAFHLLPVARLSIGRSLGLIAWPSDRRTLVRALLVAAYDMPGGAGILLFLKVTRNLLVIAVVTGG